MDSSRSLALAKRRRREAVRRAERYADRLVDRLLSAGHAVIGETIYEAFIAEKRRQLDLLAEREARRQRAAR